MKCTVPGVSLKVFGRAIQSLSKIGDELYFEPLEDGLYLRTVNPCRSAYGCFQFSPLFFVHYVDAGSTDSAAGDSSEEEPVRCKLGMKSVMTVFRNLSSLDRTVEKCCISLDMREAKLTFQMHCRHGIIKTHNMAFIECETLQAVFAKDLCPNKLTTPPKLLCDAVVNFQTNQEEVTLIVRPNYIALKNYVEDEPDHKKVIHTELTLSPDEFDNYQVGVDTSITFCLRELRAILAFADVTCQPLSLHFEAAGRPVTLSISSDLSYEANFVLATLAEAEPSPSQPPTSQHSQPAASTQHRTAGKKGPRKDTRNGIHTLGQGNSSNHTKTSEKNNSHHLFGAKPTRKKPHPHPPPSSMTMDGGGDDNLARTTLDVTMTSGDITITTDQTMHHEHSQNHTGGHSSSHQADSALRVNNEKVHNCDDDEESMDTARGSKTTEHNSTNCSPLLASHVSSMVNMGSFQNSEATEGDFDDLQSFLDKSALGMSLGSQPRLESVQPARQLSLKSTASSNAKEQSPVIPLLDTTVNQNSLSNETSEDEEDTIPGTPPSKKFRSVFFGTQSSTQPSQSQSRATTILAPNSDEEG